jgi:8-oxo-dGTP pyrophosphatase MutT (NUDIX family)
MIEDKVVFSVPWFDILARTIDDSALPYYLLRATDYVSVLAVTSEGSFLLVRQHRPAVGAETLELPSGHVEDGESPESAARRELAEETGYQANGFELLGVVDPDTGRLANKLWCFYAQGATRLQPPVDPEVGIQLVRCESYEIVRLIRDGAFNNGLHLGVLLLAAVKGRLPIS